MKRVVVKFGGTSIGNLELMRKAAKSIRRERRKGSQVAVIVSAMGHTTDLLVEAAKVATAGKPNARKTDEIVSMGEIISARIFAHTLRDLGVKSQHVDPHSKEWPVMTDSRFGCANLDLKKAEDRVKTRILPLMKKGIVPVICGFLGKDPQGRITTIGRGGSDITAFLIGKYIDADEVVIVTDAEGVMSTDPRKIRNTELLKEISAEELCDLARYGAQVLHHRALEHKYSDVDARIIHFRHANISSKGTRIVGAIKGIDEMEISPYPEPLAMLTVVGEKMQLEPGVLSKVVTPLSKNKINIFGVSIGPKSFSLYVTEKKSQKALEVIHRKVKESKSMKAVTREGGVAMIVTSSEKFIETPGVIAKLATPLARAGINVIEIYSSRASISFFINWEDREKAFKLLKESMRGM